MHMREAYEMRRIQVGDEHPSTIVLLTELGNVVRKRGQIEEARKMYFKALQLWKEVSVKNLL